MRGREIKNPDIRQQAVMNQIAVAVENGPKQGRGKGHQIDTDVQGRQIGGEDQGRRTGTIQGRMIVTMTVTLRTTGVHP